MPQRTSLERNLGWLALAATAIALFSALVLSPEDEVLGAGVRILYVHVGAAWTAYLSFVITAVAAIAYLRTRHLRWDRLTTAAAELGVVLTTVTLLTGMLWGRVAQGWWWRWDDTRLTLTLLLWFLYVALLFLRRLAAYDQRAAVSAVLAVAGLPTMALNHFAVTLYRGYHPPPVLVRPGGPAADPIMVQAAMVSVAAYTLVAAYLLVLRMRLERAQEADSEAV